jgi:hypothetical protein
MLNHLNNKTTRACDFETRLTGGEESIDMFQETYELLTLCIETKGFDAVSSEIPLKQV